MMRCKIYKREGGALFFALFLLSTVTLAQAQQPAGVEKNPVSKVWVADQGDGTYKNPIIHADYSDPDAIRVGDDFYSNGFTFYPGEPAIRLLFPAIYHRTTDLEDCRLAISSDGQAFN